MLRASESDRAEFADLDDEDTIELELSAEQVLGLSRAVEDHQAAPNLVASAREPLPASAPVKVPARASGAARPRRWLTTLVVGMFSLPAIVAMRGAAHHVSARPEPARPATIAVAAPIAPVAAPPAAPPGRPVRLRNPFDASEVFEFPPGTTRSEARQRVAAMLLERARGRRIHLPRMKRAAAGRAAHVRAARRSAG